MFRPTSSSTDKYIKEWFLSFHEMPIPISVKAYRDFIGRMEEILTPDDKDTERFTQAIELYITGNRQEAMSTLTHLYQIAFQMLMPELDRALARSGRARRQAAERKEKSRVENNHAAGGDVNGSEEAEASISEQRENSRKESGENGKVPAKNGTAISCCASASR